MCSYKDDIVHVQEDVARGGGRDACIPLSCSRQRIIIVQLINLCSLSTVRSCLGLCVMYNVAKSPAPPFALRARPSLLIRRRVLQRRHRPLAATTADSRRRVGAIDLAAGTAAVPPPTATATATASTTTTTETATGTASSEQQSPVSLRGGSTIRRRHCIAAAVRCESNPTAGERRSDPNDGHDGSAGCTTSIDGVRIFGGDDGMETKQPCGLLE